VRARIQSLCVVLGLTGALLAAQAPAGAPADGWPQFRGSSSLAGTSATTLPDALKVLWTYNAGGPIESSAAIVEAPFTWDR